MSSSRYPHRFSTTLRGLLLAGVAALALSACASNRASIGATDGLTTGSIQSQQSLDALAVRYKKNPKDKATMIYYAAALRAVGQSDAMLLLLTGERIDAQEALRIGLVSRVVAPPDLASAARSIAQRIASNAPLAVVTAKRLAQVGRELPLTAGLELEQQSFGNLRDSDDRIEGRRAFAEKRAPSFQGR